MKVFVLGAGPDGLLAAHAAAMSGHEVSILASSSDKEVIIGNPVLTSPIPQVAEGDPLKILLMRDGHAESIRRKANVSGAFVLSPRDQDYHKGYSERGLLRAWSLRDAYNKLWEKFSPYLGLNEHMNADFVSSLVESDADVVISSLSAQLLCREPSHSFLYDEILRADAEHFVRATLSHRIPAEYDGIFSLNDEKDVSWFGASLINGNSDLRWPKSANPCYVPRNEQQVVKYPAITTCDCFPMVVKVGQKGRWQSRGFLVDRVFSDMLSMLEDIQSSTTQKETDNAD